MYKDLTLEELQNRLTNFTSIMNETNPNWGTVIILSKVNQYYFTGTMQDGMLIIKNDGRLLYFVRRSYERAKDESPLKDIYEIAGYRDAAAIAGAECGNTYFETEVATLGTLERIKRHFKIESVNSVEKALNYTRAVKTPYELDWIRQSGAKHDYFLKNVAPALLREGMSEAEFVGELYAAMIKNGYQGISRFGMFQSEMVVGQVGFGESSIYPTSFDGPGGAYGMSPAVPIGGSRERFLKKGDLVFVDIAFGVNGYHSDKTQVYMFGGKPSGEMISAHGKCKDIQTRVAGLLRHGAIPSEIYHTVMSELDDNFKENFMGFGRRNVKFLGHGVGLQIDEWPVIANGFMEPLKENMVIALEPKKGIANIGMVGVEDTYLVTADGGRALTGGGSDIMIL